MDGAVVANTAASARSERIFGARLKRISTGLIGKPIRRSGVSGTDDSITLRDELASPELGIG
jgi:hypothetical protein